MMPSADPPVGVDSSLHNLHVHVLENSILLSKPHV
jgi:hypothetical protein